MGADPRTEGVMSSFINLMADDVWSEADIVNRTESIIAAEFPPARHAILQRKVQGQGMGVYVLTEQEQLELQRYALVSHQAGALADAARADMALLQHALDAEAAQRRLELPPADPPTEQDGYERQAAEAVLEAVTDQVQELLDARAAARQELQAAAPEEAEGAPE